MNGLPLSKLGYSVLRQKGSHVRLVAQGDHLSRCLCIMEIDRGTLLSIIRTAEVSVEEFNKLVS